MDLSKLVENVCPQLSLCWLCFVVEADTRYTVCQGYEGILSEISYLSINLSLEVWPPLLSEKYHCSNKTCRVQTVDFRVIVSFISKSQ